MQKVDWVKAPQWRLLHDNVANFYLKIVPTAEPTTETKKEYGDNNCRIKTQHSKNGKMVGYLIEFQDTQPVKPKIGCFGFGGFCTYVPDSVFSLSLNESMNVLYNDTNFRVLVFGDTEPIYSLIMRYNPSNPKLDIESLHEYFEQHD